MFKNIKNTLKNEGLFSLARKTIRLITRKIFLWLPGKLKLVFANKIKNFESDNIDEVIDYSFNVLGLALRPIQIREEFKELLKVYKEKKPKIVLEIGTALGGSLLCLCKLAPEDATIISIDLPGGKFGGGYPEWKTPIYKTFKKKDQKLFLLRNNSHSAESVETVKDILNGRQIDFIFLDGDHEYAGVKKDFEIYSPLIEKGGVISFHDVAINGTRENAGGVPAFWQEIKNNYKYQEFVKDANQTGYGIGCLFF